jgi:hypothetical protein
MLPKKIVLKTEKGCASKFDNCPAAFVPNAPELPQ